MVAECTDAAILGMPFLRQTKAKVDFSSFHLELHGERVLCFDESQKPMNASVHLAQNIVVEPAEIFVVPCRIHYKGHKGHKRW